MPDPVVERTARFLATHALLLPGVGVLAAVAAVAAVVWAARLAAWFRPLAEQRVRTVADRVQQVVGSRWMMSNGALMNAAEWPEVAGCSGAPK